jgi:hypothetical protein
MWGRVGQLCWRRFTVAPFPWRWPGFTSGVPSTGYTNSRPPVYQRICFAFWLSPKARTLQARAAPQPPDRLIAVPLSTLAAIPVSRQRLAQKAETNRPCQTQDRESRQP